MSWIFPISWTLDPDQWVGVSVTLYSVDTIEMTVFAQSLSIFTCKLWVRKAERRNPIDFGHWVKGQGKMWHSVHKTCKKNVCKKPGQDSLQVQSNHFQTSHASCMMRVWTILILGRGVKDQGQLWHSLFWKKPCWHHTDHSFCPLTFKLLMMKGRALLTLGYRVKG